MLEFALHVACLAMMAMRYSSVFLFSLMIPDKICRDWSTSVGAMYNSFFFLLGLSIAQNRITLSAKCRV